MAKVRRLIAAFAAVTLVAGCTGNAATPTAPTATATTAAATPTAVTPAASAGPVKIVIIPKLIGNPYYDDVHKGITDCAKDMPNVDVTWTGPSTDQVDLQIQLIQSTIATKPDVIAVAPDDAAAIVPVLQKAQAAGIHVMTWDADANFREIYVGLSDPNAFGAGFVDLMAPQVPDNAQLAIITSSFTSSNQVAWIKGINAAMAAKHPGWKIVDTEQAQEDQQLSYQKAKDIIKAYPNINGIFAVTTVALPGGAEALESLGLGGKIALVGNSQPNAIRKYILDGTIKSAQMFNPMDHGCLTLKVAYSLATTGVKVGVEIDASPVGKVTPIADSTSIYVQLPKWDTFTKDNINAAGTDW